MHSLPLLDELTLIAVVGVITTILLDRAKIPVAAGLLVAGTLAGPHGLGLVESSSSISELAEVGVVLLLYTIGLELSLSSLRRVARHILLGGSLQVGLTMLAAIPAGVALGLPLQKAIFYGSVLALSSTAVVLRVLTERGEIESPHGRFIVGALLFQDLWVVPLMLALPALAGNAPSGAVVGVLIALLKAALMVAATLIGARIVVPRLFAVVDKTRSREIFLLAVIAVCAGTAWLSARAGLSLALGAFLGGVIVAGTEHSHRALSDMLPFRNLFTSVFFVSLGMLFDPQVLLVAPGAVAILVCAFLFGKGFMATLAAMAMRFPARVAWLAGVGLAQFGEFGFVLSTQGRDLGLISADELEQLVAAGVITMFLTPLLVRIAPRIRAGEHVLRPLERLLGAPGIDEAPPQVQQMRDHVLIIGYGVAGRLMGKTLTQAGIQSLILELNPENVARARSDGFLAYYGDATSQEVLEHAGCSHAQQIVVLINDEKAARMAVASIHRLAPAVPVVLRTRYVADGDLHRSLGATDIVFEEIEAGREAVRRVLSAAGLAPDQVERQLEEANQAAPG